MTARTSPKRKKMWVSPDGFTRNQIDHVLIDTRHGSDIADFGIYRGADADSDHFLVKVKYHQRILRLRMKGNPRARKFDVQKLRTDETVIA